MTETLALTLDERLAAVRAAAERDRRRSPEETQRVLVARARALARRSNDDVETAAMLALLVVRVAGEQLALPIAAIVAVARPSSIARLPRAVPPVYGVTAWRGRTLTVLTLSTAPLALTADTRLVVLGTGARAALAIAVDAAEDIIMVAPSDITAAPAGPRAAYALGMTPDGLLAVDGDALLHPESITT